METQRGGGARLFKAHRLVHHSTLGWRVIKREGGARLGPAGRPSEERACDSERSACGGAADTRSTCGPFVFFSSSLLSSLELSDTQSLRALNTSPPRLLHISVNQERRRFARHRCFEARIAHHQRLTLDATPPPGPKRCDSDALSLRSDVTSSIKILSLPRGWHGIQPPFAAEIDMKRDTHEETQPGEFLQLPRPGQSNEREPTLEATQRQIDDFLGQLPYKRHQNRVASVGD